MKKTRGSGSRAIGLCALFLLGTSLDAVGAERGWATSDSVAVRYLVESQTYPGTINPSVHPDSPRDGSGAIIWSPGNQYFFFITHSGDLECDCNRYTLTLYAAAQLGTVLKNSALRSNWKPAPTTEVTFLMTSSNEGITGISSARWLDDDHVGFIGVQDGFRQAYRLSARDGAVTQLTDFREPDDPERPPGDDVSWNLPGVVDFELQGDSLLYTTSKYMRERPLVSRYPAISLARRSLAELFFDGAYVTEISLSRPAGAARKIVAVCDRVIFGALSVSPDGRWGLTTCSRSSSGSGVPPGESSGNFIDYLLIDTRTGQSRQIARGTAAVNPKAVWTADSAHVALSNVFLTQGSECSKGTRPYLVTYAVNTDATACVLPMTAAAQSGSTGNFKIQNVQWKGGQSGLIVTGRQSGASGDFDVEFRERNGQWIRNSPTARATGLKKADRRAVSVEVIQSANEPWKIVARSGANAIPLSTTDPALAGIRIAPMKEFRWRVGTEEDAGGLYVPEHEPGARLPLVIQAGQYTTHRFLPDGTAGSAYAAQSLVAQGFAVLNMDMFPPFERHGKSNEEWFGERVDTLVAALEREGIIDSTRVGIVGFSHGGYQVHYLLTHPRKARFTAAVVADAWTASYGSYMLYTAMSTSLSGGAPTERQYGGSFWQSKEEWLRGSPLFNVDRVTASVLFTTHIKRFAITASETLAAYRLNRKPFEFLLFPEGAHQLQRPLERKTSLDATVSWMSFWLQGREIAELQSAETYQRWRDMRNLKAEVKHSSAGAEELSRSAAP